MRMARIGQNSSTRSQPTRHLRWWIGALLFAPYLKQDYRWTNTDYANIVIAFRVAYSIGQTSAEGCWTALAQGAG